MSDEENLQNSPRLLSQIWEIPDSWRPASSYYTSRRTSTIGLPSEFDVSFLPQDYDNIMFYGGSPSSDVSSLTVTASPPTGSLAKLQIDLKSIEGHAYEPPPWAYSTSSDKTFDKDFPPTPPPEPSQPPSKSMSRPHTIAFVLVTCCAQFLSLCSMNQTVAPVILLAKYFNIFDYGTLSWFSAAYSMTVGTFILPAGAHHFLSPPESVPYEEVVSWHV